MKYRAKIAGVVVNLILLYVAYLQFIGGSVIVAGVIVVIAGFWLYSTFSDGAAQVAAMDQAAVDNLMKNGQKISTVFKAIDRDWQSKAAGESPTIVYSQDANKKVYHSKDLWFSGKDVASYDDPLFKLWQKLQVMDLKKYDSVTIPVYINPKDPREYFMDLAHTIIAE